MYLNFSIPVPTVSVILHFLFFFIGDYIYDLCFFTVDVVLFHVFASECWDWVRQSRVWVQIWTSTEEAEEPLSCQTFPCLRHQICCFMLKLAQTVWSSKYVATGVDHFLTWYCLPWWGPRHWTFLSLYSGGTCLCWPPEDSSQFPQLPSRHGESQYGFKI